MEDKFIELITEILEEDTPVRLEDRLDSFAVWDSLAVLSLVSMIDDEYEVIIGNKELETLETVGDIIKLVKSKSE